MFLSVFDIFKIGIGPSSSHTMGPMVAAGRFLDELAGNDWPRPEGARVASIKASLHGSLAFTGVGHATDRAVILGLTGEKPETIDPDRMDAIIEEVKRTRTISPPGHPDYAFNPATDLIFDRKNPLPGHANGMTLSAYDRDEALLLKRVYYSVGGGFVMTDTELEADKAQRGVPELKSVPYPFANAAQMLEMAAASGLSIAEMKRANEIAHRSEASLNA